MFEKSSFWNPAVLNLFPRKCAWKSNIHPRKCAFKTNIHPRKRAWKTNIYPSKCAQKNEHTPQKMRLGNEHTPQKMRSEKRTYTPEKQLSNEANKKTEWASWSFCVLEMRCVSG